MKKSKAGIEFKNGEIHFLNSKGEPEITIDKNGFSHKDKNATNEEGIKADKISALTSNSTNEVSIYRAKNLIKKALLIATTAIVTKKVLDRKGPKVIHQLNINGKDLEIKQLKINKAIRELEKSKNTIDELIDEGIPFETTF
ncbi:hypothetical protein BUY45_06055 [Staphylococcus devriesei]|uniref:hypothetical protein n=1 Tax=Staphylococcus devriesei TaxID=586733 RepID=UPI000D1C4B94|nr:hypothetical protein [Staphylococcus devriesei]PTF03947.1 hypothetical protein BUY45_06055 [Staphylococcus devriesei]